MYFLQTSLNHNYSTRFIQFYDTETNGHSIGGFKDWLSYSYITREIRSFNYTEFQSFRLELIK